MVLCVLFYYFYHTARSKNISHSSFCLDLRDSLQANLSASGLFPHSDVQLQVLEWIFLKWISNYCFTPCLSLSHGSSHCSKDQTTLPGMTFKASPQLQSHSWSFTSNYPNLEPHQHKALQELRCENSRHRGKSNWKSYAQTHKIRSTSEGQPRDIAALATGEFNKPEGIGKLPKWTLNCGLAKLSSCSPLTTLTGLVLIAPEEGNLPWSPDCPF